MPISIRDFRDFCDKVILNKDQSGRMKTYPFNLAVNASLTWMLNQTTDNLKDYQIGMPTSPVKWQASKAITQALRHLMERIPVKVDENGHMVIPENCYYPSDLRYPYYKNPGDCEVPVEYGKVPNSKPVKVVTNDQMAEILNSELNRPTFDYPFAEDYDTYVQVYPINIKVLWFTYLRYPAEAKYAVTFTPSGKEEFDPINSVDIDWPKQGMNQLAYKCLTYMGFNIRDLDTVQLGLNLEKTAP